MSIYSLKQNVNQLVRYNPRLLTREERALATRILSYVSHLQRFELSYNDYWASFPYFKGSCSSKLVNKSKVIRDIEIRLNV